MRALDEFPQRLLVAVGGNAIHPENIRGTSAEQREIATDTARALLPLAQLDNELVITHGNGPVVGKILMRQALTRDRIAPMPLDICVAHSQGGIAYLLVQSLENALREADSSRHVACLLTQVEVDPDDPAFDNYMLVKAKMEAVMASGDDTGPNSCETAVNFCSSTTNSSGGAAVMSVNGSCSVVLNDMTLMAEPVPVGFVV